MHGAKINDKNSVFPLTPLWFYARTELHTPINVSGVGVCNRMRSNQVTSVEYVMVTLV